MNGMAHSLRNCVPFIFFLALAGTAAHAATFSGELDPAPFDLATRADTAGIGELSATLDGNVLTIAGKFSGLASPATAAHLEMGLAEGVKGLAIADLTATRAADGEVGGKVALTRAQAEAAKKNALYVQIDSEKAPDGNLWGWLEISN
ncbi:MAG: CHRD domain-containing protein [Pseudomonadota bacterium]